MRYINTQLLLLLLLLLLLGDSFKLVTLTIFTEATTITIVVVTVALSRSRWTRVCWKFRVPRTFSDPNHNPGPWFFASSSNRSHDPYNNNRQCTVVRLSSLIKHLYRYSFIHREDIYIHQAAAMAYELKVLNFHPINLRSRNQQPWFTG